MRIVFNLGPILDQGLLARDHRKEPNRKPIQFPSKVNLLAMTQLGCMFPLFLSNDISCVLTYIFSKHLRSWLTDNRGHYEVG